MASVCRCSQRLYAKGKIGSRKSQKYLSDSEHTFDDEIICFAVERILRNNHIDAFTTVSEDTWDKILDKKTLFNMFLTYYFKEIDNQISRQKSCLKANDVPTGNNDIELRQHFLSQLENICHEKFKGHGISAEIRFKLDKAKKLSDIITKTDMDSLKDHNTLSMIETTHSLLALFRMSIIPPVLYYSDNDRIISDKCKMGNSCVTLWSGKSLNNVHMEQLKAKSEELKYVCWALSKSLAVTFSIESFLEDTNSQNSISF